MKERLDLLKELNEIDEFLAKPFKSSNEKKPNKKHWSWRSPDEKLKI